MRVSYVLLSSVLRASVGEALIHLSSHPKPLAAGKLAAVPTEAETRQAERIHSFNKQLGESTQLSQILQSRASQSMAQGTLYP